MAFYQSTVLNKYIKGINPDKIRAAYVKFKTHFHNPAVQQNIRSSKEEQYQEGFLRDLFVDIFGYTLNPNAGFNLTTEYKNVKDSKKADGAIILGQKVCAVIELKGTDTTDLDKVESQAFGYKNNQPECKYIIISNFEKLRFYIDNAIAHIEFNLFTLTEKEFELLWVCLAHESLAVDLPEKIKNASQSEEDTITKNLYKDYSLFKRELHQNLVILNQEMDELLLFKKSQKLLDRFLFLLFAEDRQLLPPNSVREILKQWNALKDLDAYTPLYNRFKLYFGYLNTGHKGKQYDIFAYNGGLFKPDDILDVVQIDDDLLYKHTLKLSDYDFASEVDVNILGHIFENSLNELDEIKAQLCGETIDKTKTKRKKDGVFYTPKYITKYIVDNTVGKLCVEKRDEFGIKDEDFSSDKKHNKNTKKLLLDKLTAYREWLLQITICDPACGSGAFLVEALDFLIHEHAYIDELQAKLFGDTLVLSDVEKSILENNLFGVDINEESVEIAKLSLWLRTAQPNRKLNDLNNNIKCGNSLIDDPTVAGEKAFNWEKEFPQVFGESADKKEFVIIDIPESPDYLKLIKEKSQEAQLKAEQGIALSKEALEITKQLAEYAEKLQAVSAPEPEYQNSKKGFDVVIGNPPYGAKIDTKQIKYVSDKYINWGISASLNDTYFIFYAKSLQNLLRSNGYLGFITPNTWKLIESAKLFRNNLLTSNYQVSQIIQHVNKVFADATVDCDTLIVCKNNKKENTLIRFMDGSVIKKEHLIEQNTLAEQDYINLFLSQTDYCLKEKITSKSVFVKDTFVVKNGVKPYEKGKGKPAQTESTMKEKPFTSEIRIDDSFSPLIGGSYFNKYQILWNNNYWIKYGEWLAAPRDKEIFDAKEKLIFRQTSDSIVGSYITEGFILRDNTHILLNQNDSAYSLKYALAILNSKLVNWFYWTINPERGEAMAQVKAFHLGLLPVYPLSNDNQQPFVVKADQMIALNKEFLYHSQKFQRMLQRKFNFEDLPVRLQNWYSLSYKEFTSELSKKKIKLSLAQEAEWEDYFSAEQTKVIEIKHQIDSTDREIDRMVYELYKLTENEISIIEGRS